MNDIIEHITDFLSIDDAFNLALTSKERLDLFLNNPRVENLTCKLEGSSLEKILLMKKLYKRFIKCITTDVAWVIKIFNEDKLIGQIEYDCENIIDIEKNIFKIEHVFNYIGNDKMLNDTHCFYNEDIHKELEYLFFKYLPTYDKIISYRHNGDIYKLNELDESDKCIRVSFTNCLLLTESSDSDSSSSNSEENINFDEMPTNNEYIKFFVNN